MKIWYQSASAYGFEPVWDEYGRTIVAQSRAALHPDTEVHVHGIPVMVRDVENWRSLQYYQNVQVMRNMQRAQAEGYDAICVGCTLDVAVAEGKAMLDIPVVGISEASYHMAMMLGRMFAVVTSSPAFIEVYGEQVDRYGVASRYLRGPYMLQASEEEIATALTRPQALIGKFRAAAARAAADGASVIIPAPGFDPGITLQTVQDERCTGVYGVPTMFIAMQNHPDFASFDLSTLRTGVMAGSICPVEVMKRCIDDMHMAEVSICYGMTETSPVSTQTRRDDSFERKVGTVGRVMPHLEIKVVDPVTRETVPRGEAGEFCTKGYSVMLGYWEQQDKTDEVLVDGWMHTGDLAVMDDDGYVQITGRIKDMVIRGGENIYPREIEEFLYTHPDIEDVQVVGVPDDRYGEELCAWVRMRTGAPPVDADAVRAYATGKLAHYKIPRYVMVVDEFPMTVTGKVRKVEMREKATADLGLDV